jgi:NADH:ubiquinone oxidoreductase subunit 6 (subunit J)
MVAGAAAVYVLLPRPKPHSTSGGIMLAALAIVSACGTILLTGAVTVETFLFYAFAVIAIVSGGLLVTQHNPARAALSFAVVILSTCGLFLLLAAPFLAVASIIIYAGAIIVTFLFVLMLAQQAGLSDADARSREPFLATLTGFLLLGALIYVLQLSYIKNDNVTQALDQVLNRTREARRTAGELKPDEFNRVSESLKEPLTPILTSEAEARSVRGQRLKDISDEIENGIARANTTEELTSALNRIERRVLFTQQQDGWVRPQADPKVLSELSGPSASERVTNLRFDDQGRLRMPADNSAYLGRSLFTDYLLPVELGGFLLLVAVVGSIAIAQRRTTPARSEGSA